MSVVFMCMLVFVLQPAGAGSGGEGDSIPGPVYSNTDGSQKSTWTLPCMEFCEKELGHTGSEVSIKEMLNAIFNYYIITLTSVFVYTL